MKPLIYNDVLAAVACVSGTDDPAAVAWSLLREAESAHLYAHSYGSAHPVFGDGSLMTAALRHQRHGDVSFATPQGRAAWISVLKAVQSHMASPRRN